MSYYFCFGVISYACILLVPQVSKIFFLKTTSPIWVDEFKKWNQSLEPNHNEFERVGLGFDPNYTKKLGLGPRAPRTGERPYKPSWIDLGSVQVKLDQE